MKGNKKGFTLIELLAVIIILAVIALIAVPVIMNIINKANKNAFKDTAYGIINAGELYFSEKQLKLEAVDDEKTFDLSKDVNTTDGIQIKGEVPKGTLKVNAKGETALAINNGRYCIIKRYDDEDVIITEDAENCFFPYTLGGLATTGTFKTFDETSETEITEVNSCAFEKTVGACDPGTPFAIRVNNTETYKFYVLEDNGDEVTLIMNQNLYEDGNDNPNESWINEIDYDNKKNENETPNVCSYDSCNDEGPISAINTLNTRTADWNYILARPYTYSGITEEDGIRRYEDITITMKARMLTYDEAMFNGCTMYIDASNPGMCPDWLSENLRGKGDNRTEAYWTSTAQNHSRIAFVVTFPGVTKYYVYRDDKAGVRPVITLSK